MNRLNSVSVNSIAVYLLQIINHLLVLHVSCCIEQRLRFLLNSDFLQTHDSVDKPTLVTSPEDKVVL